MQHTYRKTGQALLPLTKPNPSPGSYDLYPSFPLGDGAIEAGYDELAAQLAARLVQHPNMVIDGYVGVLWDHLREELDQALRRLSVQPTWTCVDCALRPPAEIDALLAPFLGGDDPLFGTRFTRGLSDFFDPTLLKEMQPDPQAAMNILYGPGAALAGWSGLLVYIDLPKNEIQFHARAGAIANLGAPGAADPKAMYKRFYFVDWIALDQHKAALMPQIDLFIDGQRPDEPVFANGNVLREALHGLARSAFRPRPWFEPGPWGGQLLKHLVPQLPQMEPNYAWSFEAILPENGLLFESGGRLLELSFDWLMHQEGAAVLGDFASYFGAEFPIRFDYLDTMQGGHLSIQVHPSLAYIRQHFGERFTQDETYYIMDCLPGAKVHLGFQEGVSPAEFQAVLERSYRDAVPLEVERYIHTQSAHPHDLFLIPNGTLHGSGAGNLVLEISATPYIYTFKVYDWLRPDLEGNLRPLNIERAMHNLRFERQGDLVSRELVTRPVVVEDGEGWRLVHLPTHGEHFYDVHRFEIDGSPDPAGDHAPWHQTDGSPLVLNLVAGCPLRVETLNGASLGCHYAETFIIPASAGAYRLVNEGAGQTMVVRASLKPGWFERPDW